MQSFENKINVSSLAKGVYLIRVDNISIRFLLKIKNMKKTFILIHILVIQFLHAQSFNGFALYNAQGSNTTYLIDENQQIAHMEYEY